MHPKSPNSMLEFQNFVFWKIVTHCYMNFAQNMVSYTTNEIVQEMENLAMDEKFHNGLKLCIEWKQYLGMEKLRVCFKLCMFKVHARFGDVLFHPTAFFWCSIMLSQLRQFTIQLKKVTLSTLLFNK